MLQRHCRRHRRFDLEREVNRARLNAKWARGKRLCERLSRFRTRYY